VNKNSEPTNDLGCKLADTFLFERKEQAAKYLGIAKFLTEFGAVIESDAGVKELNFLLSLTESRFTSWAYWEFKYFADITTQAMPGNIESFYDD
jgi:endoglycosylceramidase